MRNQMKEEREPIDKFRYFYWRDGAYLRKGLNKAKGGGSNEEEYLDVEELNCLSIKDKDLLKSCLTWKKLVDHRKSSFWRSKRRSYVFTSQIKAVSSFN